MTTAAFTATYSDWKPVKTRRIIQIIFEVPWERHDEAYQALGGMPDPGGERWFAIAQLQMETKKAGNPAMQTEDSQPNGRAAVSSRQRPNPYAQRAGILCNDIRFQKFLAERYGIIAAPDAAACKVRELCEVDSRTEIIPGTSAADRFDILESAYRVETS